MVYETTLLNGNDDSCNVYNVNKMEGYRGFSIMEEIRDLNQRGWYVTSWQETLKDGARRYMVVLTKNFAVFTVTANS